MRWTRRSIYAVTPQHSAALMALPLEEHAGRYGGWAIADQTVELDPGSDNKRGIALFAALEWGDKATAFLNWYGEAGLVRQGTFTGRDKDTIALGMAVASINGSLQGLEQRIRCADERAGIHGRAELRDYLGALAEPAAGRAVYLAPERY